MSVVWAILLLLILAAGLVLTLFGLPGNWLNLAATVGYVLLVPEDSRFALGWPVVIAVGVFAAMGEAFELLAGAMGASRAGGSRRGAVLAVCGSLVGGLLGAIVGVPIPIIGSVIAVILGAGAGAFTGAMLGERWKGSDWDKTWEVGHAAFWGRLLGTFGKVAFGSMIVVLIIFALIIP
jgi:uncharacterized protein YqgC (DUF456 family)